MTDMRPCIRRGRHETRRQGISHETVSSGRARRPRSRSPGEDEVEGARRRRRPRQSGRNQRHHAKSICEIDICAASNSPILITGETGTGKDLAANAIHRASKRKDNPFVTVNLGALPRELVEGELFGHEKGASPERIPGSAGASFLLTKAPCFSTKLIRCRLICSRASQGHREVRGLDARFREARKGGCPDYCRDKREHRGTGQERRVPRRSLLQMNVLRIEMPPLRGHLEDIPQITRALLDRMGASFPGRAIEVTASALAYLVSQPWKGTSGSFRTHLNAP